LDVSLLDPKQSPPDRAVQAGIADWLLALGCDVSSADGIRQSFTNCLRTLPADARLLHLALLNPRGLDRLRFTLGLRPAELLQWLKIIEWPGDLPAVSRWLAQIAAPWQRVFFQVEMDQKVRAHLSIETQAITTASLAGDPWSVALAAFQNAGLVSRALAGAVAAWPGADQVMWQGVAAKLKRSCYLKLVLNDGVASEVKAYLGMSRGRAFS
jgi:hypothetical protein